MYQCSERSTIFSTCKLMCHYPKEFVALFLSDCQNSLSKVVPFIEIKSRNANGRIEGIFLFFNQLLHPKPPGSSKGFYILSENIIRI